MTYEPAPVADLGDLGAVAGLSGGRRSKPRRKRGVEGVGRRQESWFRVDFVGCGASLDRLVTA